VYTYLVLSLPFQVPSIAYYGMLDPFEMDPCDETLRHQDIQHTHSKHIYHLCTLYNPVCCFYHVLSFVYCDTTCTKTNSVFRRPCSSSHLHKSLRKSYSSTPCKEYTIATS